MKCIVVFVFALMVACSPLKFTITHDGDCVDRAVKIRQELRNAGYNADIVLGGIERGGSCDAAHAWIRYRDDDAKDWQYYKNY